MGTRYALAFVILLFSTVNAQIPSRLDSLKVYVLDQANVASYTNTVSERRVARAINRACAATARDYPAIEKIDTIWVVDSTAGVALNSDFLRVRAAYQQRYGGDEAIATWAVPMYEVDYDSLSVQDPTEGENEGDPADKTEYRRFWTHANRFFTHPQWGATTDSFQVVVNYYASDNYLSDAGDTTLVRPEYREKVILYATSIIKLMQGLYDESAFYRDLYYAGRGQEE